MSATFPLHSSRRPAGMPATCLDDGIAVLEQIFHPDVAIAAWRPSARPELGAWLDANLPGREIAILRRVESTSPLSAALLAPLGRAAADSPLAAFVGELVELYAVLADTERVGLRLCVTRGRPCPRFHVDRVGLRLICTLRGPATEWLEPEDVDRSRLGTPEADDARSGLLRPGAQVRRLEPLDVALFKGEAWPGNAGRGAVHRSPVPDGRWRALLTLDAI